MTRTADPDFTGNLSSRLFRALGGEARAILATRESYPAHQDPKPSGVRPIAGHSQRPQISGLCQESGRGVSKLTWHWLKDLIMSLKLCQLPWSGGSGVAVYQLNMKIT